MKDVQGSQKQAKAARGSEGVRERERLPFCVLASVQRGRRQQQSGWLFGDQGEEPGSLRLRRCKKVGKTIADRDVNRGCEERETRKLPKRG